ncbi:hypothetical protein AADZ90_006265 [Aestuariibius sp. 2305UL40-4]|uniref:hypothetical protein n=1 Tax=Aestuariibius violaceus TaxID=3234132 RepID=UPI00345E8EE0
MEDVSFKLSREMQRALATIARHEDVTIGAIVRGAIERDLRRRQAKPPDRADERLVAPLRALLADDLAYASGWKDLAQRLRRKGYVLREAGGGLVLCDTDGKRLCKASELGCSYIRLAERFNAPFPHHRHRLGYR